ncbi:MAG TPA: HAMP domain-containing protein [Desulfocapsa sulfexigens]|nr:HAMP domain-containing protein [Desulfocapsa sulfexigens]
MIVFCEDCGKKYKINLHKIKGDSARFKCKSCDHFIRVTKPKSDLKIPEPSEHAELFLPEDDLSQDHVSKGKSDKTIADITMKYEDTVKIKGMGLRGKMLLLFFMLPITIIAASGLLYIWQLNSMASLVSQESTKIVQQLAEDMIASRARAVALQCKIFLDANPELTREKFNNSPSFKQIAVQKVGLTGYTALYEKPGNDGIWRTWAHANPKIIGVDMMKLKKKLGEKLAEFWKIFTGIENDTESKGYYTWHEQDGEFRDKFMVSTPIPGTSYVISATTYIDEFTRPIKLVQPLSGKITKHAKYTLFGIVFGTMVLVGLTVTIYGNLLIRRISRLTAITNRISMGDMDAKLIIDSGDELGILAEAIERMQESIRLSLERLRRRRTR